MDSYAYTIRHGIENADEMYGASFDKYKDEFHYIDPEPVDNSTDGIPDPDRDKRAAELIGDSWT